MAAGQSTQLFLYSDGLNCKWCQRTSIADGSIQIETCRWQTAEGRHQKTQMRLRGRSPQSERRELPCWTSSSVAIYTRLFLLFERQAKQFNGANEAAVPLHYDTWQNSASFHYFAILLNLFGVFWSHFINTIGDRGEDGENKTMLQAEFKLVLLHEHRNNVQTARSWLGP